ncbi:MAG: PorT family protein, partial [Alistipes sp.]|nr:PorT family protein [Alistipes sp.]
MPRHIKNTILILAAAFCLASPPEASAQHYLGVRGGYGGGNSARFFPKQGYQSSTLWGLYNGGVSWKYYTKEKYAGGTEVDILFMQQGFKEYGKAWSPVDSNDSTAYYSRKVNSVVVPIFWQPHAYLFRRNMRVFLNLGVTFSYNISQTYERGSDQYGEIYESGDYNMTLIKDKRWGYGLCGGGGLGWSFGRIEAVAEFRYYIGYSDLQKNKNKYYNDSESNLNRERTPIDGLQGSIAIYYRFGKKGILSPPSPKMEQKLREIEQKRLARSGIVVEGEADGEPP